MYYSLRCHGTSRQSREAALQDWYRRLLRKRLPELIAKWESAIGVKIAECRIKRMKTRWGSCNVSARRVWLNLELAKKHPSCLEFILVHEMVHLLERHHNDQFREYMDRFMPKWRLHREELNRAPLGHESWGY
jgi:predicted metal-dependent hydrolase